MKRARFAVAILSLVIATSSFAGRLDKLKDWDRSPQGYFMTKAEHQEWSAVQTDEDAQRFVDQFLAKRGPKFAAEVADRAAQADKHLTIGGLAGSKTLRGKLVILLGPPSNLDLSDVSDSSAVHRSSPAVANAYSGGSSAVGEDDSNEGSKTMGSSSTIRNYHFVYASSVSGPFDVTISTDPNTGKDRPRDRESSKRLDAVFEAAAQASIKVK